MSLGRVDSRGASRLPGRWGRLLLAAQRELEGQSFANSARRLLARPSDVFVGVHGLGGSEAFTQGRASPTPGLASQALSGHRPDSDVYFGATLAVGVAPDLEPQLPVLLQDLEDAVERRPGLGLMTARATWPARSAASSGRHLLAFGSPRWSTRPCDRVREVDSASLPCERP